ncbi:MAG: hypothetical protein OXI95_02910 [bacterium]|nr:hypothetical protein [Rhodospirillaceae bacterium]MDE0415873.1 hypothetical protein [bacterium]
MTDRAVWTASDLRAVATALHGSPQGAVPALARCLDVDQRLVRRWTSGSIPVPVDVVHRIEAITGISAPPETAWRRDEWLTCGGQSRTDEQRRRYIVHTWPPRFRCRAVVIDSHTGLPVEAEQPADVERGLIYAASPDTVLAEFDWIDRPPSGEALTRLLEAASDAIDNVVD